MSGGSTTNQNQQQSSSTSPYAPTQADLQGILNTLGSTSTAPTAAQTAGTNQLVTNATNAPDFSGAATGVVNNLLSGGGSNNYAGILNSSYGQLQNELNPYASGSQIGANSALQPELNTIGNDTQNNVQSQFASAGRSFSPAEAQAIARGTAQGEAPVMANQYNADVANQMAAAGTLNTAAGNTASGLNTLNQTQLGNETTGLTAAQAIPGILNQNANSLISAGTAQQNLPYSGVSSLESLLLPIAGAGSQSTGTSQGTTTQQTSPVSNILGGLLGGAGLLGKFLPSDIRVKEDIEKVGILNDGQNIYRYKYKSDPNKVTHIGLLAQETERRNPDAVAEIGGVKHVDYNAATERAAA
jgi:hypothetical protein